MTSAFAVPGCGQLLGLDGYQSVSDEPDDDDSDGGGGSDGDGDGSGGSGSGGRPPADCTDTESGSAVDEGCTSQRPFCVEGGCAECVRDADCTDDELCTLDSCDDGVCSHEALGTATVLLDSELLNGSFEDVTLYDGPNIPGDPEDPNDWDQATGWPEFGSDLGDSYQAFQLTYDCSAKCTFGVVSIDAADADRILWLGGLSSWQDYALSPLFTIPSEATHLEIFADLNVQTLEASNETEALDEMSVLLLDDDDITLSTIAQFSNLDARNRASWTRNGLVRSLPVHGAWKGADVRLEFSSINDGSGPTDFGVDHVRVVACQ